MKSNEKTKELFKEYGIWTSLMRSKHVSANSYLLDLIHRSGKKLIFFFYEYKIRVSKTLIIRSGGRENYKQNVIRAHILVIY